MSLTITTPASYEPFVAGNLRVTVRDIVLQNPYTVGGEDVSANDLGLSSVHFAIPTVKVAGTGSITAVSYLASTHKLLAYTAAAEAGAVDLSGVTIRIFAFGK